MYLFSVELFFKHDSEINATLFYFNLKIPKQVNLKLESNVNAIPTFENYNNLSTKNHVN